jgi:dihydroorotate dehydrogenase
MSIATYLSRVDHTLRPFLGRLPSGMFTRLYSSTRPWFSKLASNDNLAPIEIPQNLRFQFKHLVFRSRLGNAAGMFKQAEGYERAYAQGAGFYLCGTTTSLKRAGNTKNGIHLPFVPYPKSHAASNWLGLPNDGHIITAKKISTFPRYPDFPIGASISMDPGMDIQQGVKGLLDGIHAYVDAGCDFLELNESCPNVPGHETDHSVLDESLLHRLDAISSIFKTSSIPVFVKFSNDTDPNLVSQLLKALMERGFSGVNFGNTSTRYEHYETFIHPHDKDHYKYFVNSFGGGLSGRLLRQNSELLIQQADAYCKRQSLQDFLIIATGGIETKHDFNQALEHGAHLAQWYTGYYEQFGIHGNAVYAAMYK